MNTHIIKRSLLALSGAFLSTTLAHGQIESGLLNYWALDGDAVDTAPEVEGSSGTTADDGMINGTVSFTDATAELGAGFGQVGNFPGGAGNNITVADPSAGVDDIDRTGSDLSISVWIKANEWNTGWQAIIAHGEGSDYRVARRGSDNPVLFSYAGGTGDIATSTSYGSTPAGDGNWHHIVATTGTGGVTQLFVNGVLEATSGGAPTIGSSGANNNVLCIGCNPDNGREFNGLMDDIAMWDRVITAQEVTDIYDAGAAGDPLSALFPIPGDDDGDGLPNSWEERYGLDPDDDGTTDPNNGPDGDPDNDNVTNINEFNNNTFPDDDDSDDDTLKDGVETNNGENSFVDATNTGTDPRNPDTDGDGLSDGVEDAGGSYVSDTQTGSDPTVVDSDSDTMPDGYEVTNSQDPNTDDGALDPDTDDLDNLGEFTAGTNSQVADTDMDGLNDGPEINVHNTDPLNADSDGDTLSDGDEVNVHETDPNLTDSDGDLFSDDDEIAEGTDPNDPNSQPVVPELPEPLLYYPFDTENGTEVENFGSLATAGVLQGAGTYGESVDASFGTAFVGNRTDVNDAQVLTGHTGNDLGMGGGGVYTAMAWINWAGSSGGVDHMVFGAPGAGNFEQLHHGIRDDSAPNNIHFGGWGGAQDVSDAGAVPVGEWTHVAWQYDGADKVVYVNGAETTRVAGNNVTNPSLDVAVGFTARDGMGSFNGSIDEVKIYGAALTAAQVREAMVPSAGAGGGLAITSIDYNNETNNITISFNSRPGRTYTLFWTPDFADRPDYNEIDDGVDADAVENLTTYTFPIPNEGAGPVSKAFFIIQQN